VPEEPLRVAYQTVIEAVPKFLTCESPKYDIILHMGLAAGRKHFTLERQSCRDGYTGRDVDGCYFPKSDATTLFSHCPEVLKPTFDSADLGRRWEENLAGSGADLRLSDDPGTYLCGFIYYLSMSWLWKRDVKERPIMFMHVPDLPTEKDIEQGRQVAIGLIRALVESRKSLGVYDPLKDHAGEQSDQADAAETNHEKQERWAGY
jgi:pyroglutamyl-peptidase